MPLLTYDAPAQERPLTDLGAGRLRGWVRIFTRKGFALSVASQNPLDPRPQGDPPTVEEWAAFDAEANRQGVGGYVAALKKNAIPKQDFLGKVTAPVAQAINVLDTYAPGWATLVDAMGPMLPVLPVITTAIAAVAELSPVITQDAFKLLGTAVQGKPEIYHAPSDIQQQLGTYIAEVAMGSVEALAPIRWTLVKFGATVAATKGDLEQKLLAAVKEVAQGAMLCITVGCFATAAAGAVLTAGLAAGAAGACQGLMALSAMLGAGVTLVTARQIAEKAKEVSKQAAREAAQEAAALDDEARRLQQEIDRLRRARGQVVAEGMGPATKAAALVAAALVAGKVLG